MVHQTNTPHLVTALALITSSFAQKQSAINAVELSNVPNLLFRFETEDNPFNIRYCRHALFGHPIRDLIWC